MRGCCTLGHMSWKRCIDRPLCAGLPSRFSPCVHCGASSDEEGGVPSCCWRDWRRVLITCSTRLCVGSRAASRLQRGKWLPCGASKQVLISLKEPLHRRVRRLGERTRRSLITVPSMHSAQPFRSLGTTPTLSLWSMRRTSWGSWDISMMQITATRFLSKGRSILLRGERVTCFLLV